MTGSDNQLGAASTGNGNEEGATKKGIKKRKWGSKTSKAAKTTKRTASMEISTDVLKNLIGDVKLTETVFEMETEVVNTLDYDEQEDDRRDVKMDTTVQPSDPEVVEVEQEDDRKVETRDQQSPEKVADSPPPEKKIIKLSSAAPKAGIKSKQKEGKKDKDEKKKSTPGKEKKSKIIIEKENKDQGSTLNLPLTEKVFATTRQSKPLLPAVDEPEPVSGRQSPAHNPPDRVICISDLVRPFTVGQLKELLRRTGELDDDYFWINEIKSHCLATYKTVKDAVAARAALHGTRWPQSNPKILIVDFATVEDVIRRKEEGDLPFPTLIKRHQEKQKKMKEPKIVKKEKRQRDMEKKEHEKKDKEKEVRDKREARDKKREAEKKNPVREWDRDKIQQMSRSRSRTKSKERDPVARRSRSRDRDQRKRRGQGKDRDDKERSREKRQKDAKTEEEPPAKLLDDLFRKTKATPCIYWLPLTEEQAQQRMIKRQEQEKERLKRIAAAEEREKEELKKRELARLERQRERARDRSRDRERGKQERSRSSPRQSRSRSRRRR